MKIEVNEDLPSDRTTFEHHLYMVVEKGINGTIHLTERTVESMKKVRKLPNGRVDLNTINESARTIMNMVAQERKMKTDEEKKKK